MYNGIRARGGIDGSGMIYSVYFVILVLFGNCILLLNMSHSVIKIFHGFLLISLIESHSVVPIAFIILILFCFVLFFLFSISFKKKFKFYNLINTCKYMLAPGIVYCANLHV